MRRIKITLAYDGTQYHGWQVQPALTTIQGTLQDVLAEIEGHPIHVEGSGRTDAGEHALAQDAAFSLDNPIPLENLQRAMNRLLPRDIRVLSAEEREAFTIETSDGGALSGPAAAVRFRFHSEEMAIGPDEDLAALVFGCLERPVPDAGPGPLGGILRRLFPLPLPGYGHNYI